MTILPCREYHIYRRYQGDDGVLGQRLNERPLESGLWCAMQTMYRFSRNPDLYLPDSYLKLVSYATDGEQLLCAAILLEEGPEIVRPYYLQYTDSLRKKTYNVCSLESGIWCCINTMIRNREARMLIRENKVDAEMGGYYTLMFYHGKSSLTKVLVYMGATL